jgi:hypothetical protein
VADTLRPSGDETVDADVGRTRHVRTRDKGTRSTRCCQATLSVRSTTAFRLTLVARTAHPASAFRLGFGELPTVHPLCPPTRGRGYGRLTQQLQDLLLVLVPVVRRGGAG